MTGARIDDRALGTEQDGPISVIVATMNGGQNVEAQVRAILDQMDDVDGELIVVNNGSTDDTAVRLARLSNDFTELKVLSYPAPLGVNAARNAGAREASGKLLLFSDHDDLVADGWAKAMLLAWQSGGRLLCGTREYVRLNSHIDGFRTVPDGAPPAKTDWMPFAYGSAIGVDRRLFDELGGWDERFRFGCDDVAFSWTAQLRGCELTAVPDAVVHIRMRADLRSLASQRYRYGIAESLLFQRFRYSGMPRDTVGAIRRLLRMFALAPLCIWTPVRRRFWVRTTLPLLGRVHGAIRYRTVYLG